MTGRGQPDTEPPRAVPSGLSRRYTAAEQRAPLDAYVAMVAGHDASCSQVRTTAVAFITASQVRKTKRRETCRWPTSTFQLA